MPTTIDDIRAIANSTSAGTSWYRWEAKLPGDVAEIETQFIDTARWGFRGYQIYQLPDGSHFGAVYYETDNGWEFDETIDYPMKKVPVTREEWVKEDV